MKNVQKACLILPIKKRSRCHNYCLMKTYHSITEVFSLHETSFFSVGFHSILLKKSVKFSSNSPFIRWKWNLAKLTWSIGKLFSFFMNYTLKQPKAEHLFGILSYRCSRNECRTFFVSSNSNFSFEQVYLVDQCQ